MSDGIHIDTCDVCFDIWGDAEAKEVRWCKTCKANICETCWADWPARLIAAARRGLGHKYGRVKSE